MYGKIFEQIFDSSLMKTEVTTRYVFMSLIAICDSDGVVDIIHDALARKLNITEDELRKAIKELEKEDPDSRSNVANGRRLSQLDAHRSWGWRIVNHEYYKRLANREAKKVSDRERIAKKRYKSDMSQSVASCSIPSQSVESVANVAHADEHANADEDTKRTPLPPKGDSAGSKKSVCQEIFEHWQKIHKHPQSILTPKIEKIILARLKEGYSKDRIFQAIENIRNSSHHMGKNDTGTVYDSLELICRSGSNVDRFADLVVAKAPPDGLDRYTNAMI